MHENAERKSTVFARELLDLPGNHTMYTTVRRKERWSSTRDTADERYIRAGHISVG